MEATELEVLVDQLDELLTGGIEDEDDAIELAVVAGLAARLGAPADVLASAVQWRDGPGAGLLADAWPLVDLDGLVEAIDDASAGAPPAIAEEAVFDFDDVICAAAWCGQRDRVRPTAVAVARTIRTIPDAFAPLASEASDLLRLQAVALDLDLYDYLVAVAEAAAWAEE